MVGNVMRDCVGSADCPVLEMVKSLLNRWCNGPVARMLIEGEKRIQLDVLEEEHGTVAWLEAGYRLAALCVSAREQHLSTHSVLAGWACG
jgi:hypothetical protein